jgi:putative ABC transport system permease protein
MIRLALSDLRGHRLRTILSIVAVTLGVALVTGALTLTNTMTRAADSLSTAAYGGVGASVTAKTNVDPENWMAATRPTTSQATLERVAHDPQVAAAAGEVQSESKIVVDGEIAGAAPYFGVGYDFSRPGAEKLTPFRLDSGRWPKGPGEVVIDAQTASKSDLKTGESVKVASDGKAARDFQIVGISTFGNVRSLGSATTALFDLATAQQLFDKQGRLDTVLAAAKPGTTPQALRAGLDRRLPASMSVRSAAAQDRFGLDELKQFVHVLQVILLVLGIVAVIVGAFTIANALSMSVTQQQRSLALLRAVGASRRQVRRLVRLQALAIGAAGTLLGVAAGFGIAAGLGSLFDTLGMGLPTTAMTLTSGVVIAAVIVGIGVPLFAARRPARLATRISPVSAMREAVDVPRPGIFGRFVRAIASVVGRVAELFGGTAGSLARRNAMRRPGRTAATAAALTIGVTLVAAVGVVVAGLKGGVKSEATKRITADLVVASEDQGWGPASPEQLKQVASVKGVERVGALAQDRAKIGKTEVSVDGLDATGAQLLRYDVTAGRRDLRAGEALVTKKFAAKKQLEIGDPVTLLSPRGKRLTVTIAGLTDPGKLNVVGLGEVALPWQTYRTTFGSDTLRFGLVDAAGDTGTVRAAIAHSLAGFPGAYVGATEKWAKDQAAWLDIVVMVIVVMLALAVIVSLLGIVNTLAMGVVERTREIGLLRAAGMTRRQVRRMVRWESTLTALVGAAIGVAFGLGLGGLIAVLFGDEGFSFAVPTGMLMAIAVVAVVAGVIAAALPARRAARLDVLHAVTVD